MIYWFVNSTLFVEVAITMKVLLKVNISGDYHLTAHDINYYDNFRDCRFFVSSVNEEAKAELNSKIKVSIV